MVGDREPLGQPGFRVEPIWFRPPTEARPGTLNLCYGALDVQVVRGRAAEPVVVRPDGSAVEAATLLEQVGALAGALRLVGVDVGTAVSIDLDDPYDELLAVLACARLGAPHGDRPESTVAIASRADGHPAATARLLRGVPIVDPDRDVTWEIAYRAGREDPAPCAEVSSDAVAWEYGGRPVRCRDALADHSPPGELLAALTAGAVVDCRQAAEGGGVQAGDLGECHP